MVKISIWIVAMLSSLAAGYQRIKSCEEARETGIYTIEYESWAVDAICDMETDGGGWLVILNRKEGTENFFKNWREYRDNGVGSPETEYILPLEFLHHYLA